MRGSGHVESPAVLLVAVPGLGRAVMPLFLPGGDETLDPTRPVMPPPRPRPLVRVLARLHLVAAADKTIRRVRRRRTAGWTGCPS
ncbi:hypothetical protein ADK41_15685 [Streptomyces caelestis]|uniref:Uncharacterized protein n=1 Tax=Streptomyces caelestis TaxID=36816 RepID=A0A0M9X8W9_9ACTN|nr:hypothetical protein ADK41_15685 [Streptomyces caelestis]